MKVYLNMPFNNSDSEKEQENIQRACAIAVDIRKHFPNITLFVPQEKPSWGEKVQVRAHLIRNSNLILSIGQESPDMEVSSQIATLANIPQLEFEEFEDTEKQILAEFLSR